MSEKDDNDSTRPTYFNISIPNCVNYKKKGVELTNTPN